MSIPFNKIYHAGNEERYINLAIKLDKITGNGKFSSLCALHLRNSYSFNSVHLTASCTAALETAALLLNIQPGDEVVLPSYTFVSTANAFVLRGAKIVFADSENNNPNMDAEMLEPLISKRTKAIVVVHYAGIACDMKRIMEIANRYSIPVVEDAAHSIDAYYKDQPLGSIGSVATFSFHETKNITSGEGGALVINDKQFCERAEIILDKGTNRKAFAEGKTDKYEWVDIGSSYRMSELNAAFLLAQLEQLNAIQKRRLELWNAYYDGLKILEKSNLFSLPIIPAYAKHNASFFYIVCPSQTLRDKLIRRLSNVGISAAFHYQPLHLSPFYNATQNKSIVLTNAEKYGNCLLRLPLHANLTVANVSYVIDHISEILKTEI